MRERRTKFVIATGSLLIYALILQQATASPVRYGVYSESVQRGTTVLNHVSVGAYTATAAYFAFQSRRHIGDYTSSLSFATDYLDFKKDSGTAIVSARSGAGGIGMSPFVFTTWQPSTTGAPQLFTFTGAEALIMTFSYQAGAIRYIAAAMDRDPATGDPVNLSISGRMNTQGNFYTAVLRENFTEAGGQPNSLSVTFKGTSGTFSIPVPEPGAASAFLTGILGLGISLARRSQRMSGAREPSAA